MSEAIETSGPSRPVYVMRLKHAITKEHYDLIQSQWCQAWMQSGHHNPPGLLILDPSVKLAAYKA